MRNFGRLLAVALLLAPFAAAQDPLKILESAAAKLENIHKTSFDFDLVETREYLGTHQNTLVTRHRIAGAGGRYHEQIIPAGLLSVYDGAYRWTYNPERNEYTKAAANYQFGPGVLSPVLAGFTIAAHRVKSARLVGQETLELAGGRVTCQVIEAVTENSDGRTVRSPTTYWIDASRNLVLKSSYRYATKDPSPIESVITTTFAKASIGGAVDQNLLRFTPPDGSVEVERLTFGPKSLRPGTALPDFELQGADLQTITSASLKGNAVLLLFAAGADDENIPFVEMLHRSLRGKGLAAFVVMASRIRRPVEERLYTVPFTLDPGQNAAGICGISRSGTVLIDRDGKIAFADTLSRDWQGLAKALQKAGVW